jgi:hypothetical protein
MCELKIDNFPSGSAAICKTHSYGWQVQPMEELYPYILGHLIEAGTITLKIENHQ